MDAWHVEQTFTVDKSRIFLVWSVSKIVLQAFMVDQVINAKNAPVLV
jgi:hypothetical protein